MVASPLGTKYGETRDRDSAYEALSARAAAAASEAEVSEALEEAAPVAEREYRAARRYSGTRVGRSSARQGPGAGLGAADTAALGTAIVKELKGTTGRRLVRGVMGGLFKGR